MGDGALQVAETTQQMSNLVIESKYTLTGFFPVMYELLSQYMTGYELLALELTCSKGILTRLRRAQIRRFWIGPIEAPNWPLSGFAALSHYRSLTSFTIHNSILPVMKKGPVLLEKLPPTIRHLSLRIPYRLGTWLLVIPPSRMATPTKQKRKSKRAAVEVDLDQIGLHLHSEPQDFNLASLFPNLATIEISGGISYGVGAWTTTVTPETSNITIANFVRSLPRTFMQRVSLPTLGENTWQVLVPSLTVLSQSFGSTNRKLSSLDASKALNQAKTLPDTLQDLDIIAHECTIPWDALYELPSELSRLHVDISLSSFPDIYSSEAGLFFSRLPKNLTDLSLDITPRASTFNSEIFLSFNRFPSPALTRLTLQLKTAGTLQPWLLEAMPRTLTELTLTTYHVMINEHTSLAALPPNLKFFLFKAISAHHAPRIPYAGYLKIPSSIESLELGNTFAFTDVVFSALPRELTSLTLNLSCIAFENHVCTNACFMRCRTELERMKEFSYYLASPTLPPTPTPVTPPWDVMQAAIYGDLSTLPEEYLANGSEMKCLTDEGASFGLPPLLSSLTLHASSFGPSFFQALDTAVPQLGHLSFATDQILPRDSLASLPALTSLHISTSPYLCPQALNCLPPSLTYLHVDDARLQRATSAPTYKRDSSKPNYSISQDDSERPFDWLPSIKDEVIALLPRSLVTLHLTGGASLTDACAKSLPRTLTSLTLTASSTLTADALSSLPRPLHVFKVSKIIMPHPRPSRASMLASIPQTLQVGELPWFTVKNRKVDFSTIL